MNSVSVPAPAPSVPALFSRAESLLARLEQAPPALLLIAAWSIQAALSIVALTGESCTNDEVVHLPAGYTYVLTGDYRLNLEHPPLVKSIAGLPLLFQNLPWPQAEWKASSPWDFGFRLFYHLGADAERILLAGRLPMLLWGFLLVGACAALSRELFGPRGALITIVLATFSPEILSHGHYVHTDVALAALGILSVAAVRNLGRTGTVGAAACAGVTVGGMMVAKFSSVLFLPALPAAYVLGRMQPAREDGLSDKDRRIRDAAFVGIALLLAYLVIWGAYGFRFRATIEPLTLPGRSGAPITRILQMFLDNRLFPEGYLHGLAIVLNDSGGRHSYAMGIHSFGGWLWYFPFAWLVKTPTAAVALMLWGLAATWRRIAAGDRAPLFLVAGLALFGLGAAVSRFNIGIRHIIPMYPFLFILAGAIGAETVAAAASPRRRPLVLALLAGCALEVAVACPYFLAFFNTPSTLFVPRHELLADSNLDWGQDLGRLKKYLDREGIPEIKLAYFGSASPRYLKLKHQKLPGINTYGRLEPEWQLASPPEPGDTVAVSATMLVGILLDDRDRYWSRFGRMKPIGSIGHSILLYRVPPNGVP